MPKKIVTHNSRFHADDVFASAVVLTLFPDAIFIRTRDEEIIKSADIVFDVGNIYDPNALRFDHHQQGGAGIREGGIPYASFGLIWKHFGLQLCKDQKVVDFIDKRLVQSIDASDNGIDLYTPKIDNLFPYSFQSIVGAFTNNWQEDDTILDQNFMDVSSFAKKILDREIKNAKAIIDAEQYVLNAYDQTKDKRIIVLDDNYPWKNFILQKSEPLFVVKPSPQSTNWKVEAIPVKDMSYENRKYLPESWVGKRDLELAKVTGVSDAVFCHNGRFLAVAKSKEGALHLAQIAVES
jgi:uncharacterized UPF0160 family protein